MKKTEIGERKEWSTQKVVDWCYFALLAVIVLDVAFKCIFMSFENSTLLYTAREIVLPYKADLLLNSVLFVVIELVVVIATFLLRVFLYAKRGKLLFAEKSRIDNFPMKRYVQVSAIFAGALALLTFVITMLRGVFDALYMLKGLLYAVIAFAIIFVIMLTAFKCAYLMVVKNRYNAKDGTEGAEVIKNVEEDSVKSVMNNKNNAEKSNKKSNTSKTWDEQKIANYCFYMLLAVVAFDLCIKGILMSFDANALSFHIFDIHMAVNKAEAITVMLFVFVELVAFVSVSIFLICGYARCGKSVCTQGCDKGKFPIKRYAWVSGIVAAIPAILIAVVLAIRGAIDGTYFKDAIISCVGVFAGLYTLALVLFYVAFHTAEKTKGEIAEKEASMIADVLNGDNFIQS